MQICIAGWHYWEELLDAVKEFDPTAYVVGHKFGDTRNLNATFIQNVGLCLHCYDYFVKEKWDGTSDVLFLQDDLVIKDPTFFDDVLALETDRMIQIFDSKTLAHNNKFHTRSFKCGAKFLRDQGGFEYDKHNHGDTVSAMCNVMDGHYWNVILGQQVEYHITDKYSCGIRGNEAIRDGK